jgi:DNA adenine methylase
VKPPFPYYGGKQRLAARIVSLLPDHGHYVEPFAGSLAVLLAKPPSRMETINDLDREVVTFWRVLRDRPDELVAACELTPHALAEYDACRKADDTVDEVEVARRLWVKLSQGRASATGNTKAGWRHHRDPGGSTVGIPAYLDGYRRRLHPAAERLRAVSIECRPALDVIRLYGTHEKVLLYVDPPYLPGTRTSTGYRHELTDADHAELVEALDACRGAVVLSGYASALYDDQLDHWHRLDIPTATGQGGTWEPRTEVLWSNRPLATGRLFDLGPADSKRRSVS